MPPHGDELASFFPSMIPHSTQYLSSTLADPAAQIPPQNIYMEHGIDNYDAAAPQAGPVHVGAGSKSTTETQHLDLDEEDAQRRLDSWKSDVEQRLLGEEDTWTVSDEKLMVEAPAPAPAPEDGRPSGRDADMAEVNAAGIEHVEEDTLDELRQSTSNFSDDQLIGEGAFGKVYKVRNGAETSRRERATAPRRQQPPHGVGRQSRRGRCRQSPSAVALFLSKKGKHVRREAAGLPRAPRVSNATSSRCNRLGSIDLTLDVLRQITNNFYDDQLIGEGAFGKVYKGVLPNGDVIAVKRFASTITGLQDAQYENEAQHFMRLKHPNIVQLVGYCSGAEVKLVWHNGIFVRAEEPERLLCLEYMPKGSLRDHLSDETSGLEWDTRYRIIEGICYGLHYLHEEWQATPIIHMDLKPANILLDDNMVPKIADFGLSRLFGEDQTRTCTRSCKGTPGYMAPEYLEKGVITKMFDIFSLGVIIIEIITGHKDYPTDETETASQQYIDLVLNNWRHRLTKAQGTSQDIDYQQIKKCIEIGLLCVKFDRVKRPTINQIIKMLERSHEAYQNEREVPRRPEVKMTPHGDGDDIASFPARIQDLPKAPADTTAQIPPDTAMGMNLETLSSSVDAPKDRRPWSTDAGVPWSPKGRAPCCDKASVKRGPWSPEEDEKLLNYIRCNGSGCSWTALPRKAGLNRSGKSCRQRWLNYLRPNIKHGGYTEQEDRIICALYNSIGSRWSIIASKLPGRTDNDVKNYWNTKLKKKALAGVRWPPPAPVAAAEEPWRQVSATP